MGKVAIAARECVTNQQINSVVVESGNDPMFVYYNLSTRKEEIQRSAAGSAQPILNKTAFGRLVITLPPLPEQCAIAAILGGLDDKIELNRRMNRTLEAIAQALFKSWFVDFDPVRAKAEGGQPFGMDGETAALFPDSFEDSELGEIPSGWWVGQVKDLGQVVCGKTPPTKAPANYGNDVPFITIPDMHGKLFVVSTAKALSFLGAATQPTKTIPSRAICVSCIATPGLVVMTTERSQTNQQINSLVPFDGSSVLYCFFALRRLGEEIRTRGSGGSVFSNLNTSAFQSVPILVPGSGCLARYQESVGDLCERVLLNERHSANLANSRDALPPKLLSGEIRVKEAEKIAEAVM